MTRPPVAPARILARMQIVAFLVPWVLIGIGVIFVAFSGGPGAAREAYMTRGRKAFGLVMVLVYVGIGIAIPAVVIASRGTREGNSQKLSQKVVRDQPAYIAKGVTLFRENCASCHNLNAAGARGVTGPDLDKIGTVTPARVLSAIRIGGTGQKRMPSGLLQGANAQAVARYVAAVAGQ
jgi:Cytochrome C oxidase, cbb3-type, subunit III